MGADTCDALSTRRVLRIYAVEVEGFGLQPRYHHVVSSVGTRSKQMELMQYLKSVGVSKPSPANTWPRRLPVMA